MTTAAVGGSVMLMKARERWHCTNTECGCQVVVEIGGEIEGQNPPLRLRRDPAQKIRFAGLHLSGFALRSAADPPHASHTQITRPGMIR
jgi:hypothetical protein